MLCRSAGGWNAKGGGDAERPFIPPTRPVPRPLRNPTGAVGNATDVSTTLRHALANVWSAAQSRLIAGAKGNRLAKAYIVIARSGMKRGRYFDGIVVREDSIFLPPYRKVFGPTRRTQCLIWRATHCDPLPEWRGAENRVVYLRPPAEVTEMGR